MRTRLDCRTTLISAILLTSAASLPGGAAAATAIVTVTATVVRNLSVATRSNLSFGALDTSASAGAVILRQDGSRRAVGGARVEPDGVATPARLVLRGEPNAYFTLEIPRSARIADSRQHTMQVDHFITSTGAVGNFQANGRADVSIGATLHVGPNQALGSYSGTIEVSVNYN